MKKKIIILGLVLPLMLACAKKKTDPLQNVDGLELPSREGHGFGKDEIGQSKDENAKRDFYYYDYPKSYKTIAASRSGKQEAFPNGEFKEWHDVCWLWGKNLPVKDSKKIGLFTASKKEFQELFNLKKDWTCDNLTPDDTKKNDAREFVATNKNVRLLPVGYLSSRHAQAKLNHAVSGVGYFFNGAALTHGTSETGENDKGLIRKLDEVEGGIALKTIGGIANVNGQITTGIPRADKLFPSAGFVQTVHNLAEGLGRMPFTSKPTKLVAVVKYSPKGDDKGTIEVMLHGGQTGVRLPFVTRYEAGGKGLEVLVGDNALAYVRLVLTKEIKDWETITVPIYYKNEGVNPEFLLMNISSSFGYDAVANSELQIKSLQFIYE